jgi:two-component system, sensor histidine kinase and response regulator
MTEEGKNVVLVVDDTEQNLSVVGNILLENDYEIQLVTSGEEAFESLNEIIPDLILLDVMMPGMDGHEVIRRLKSDDKYMEIPVIFLTAKVETEDVVKGFELGAVDYVTKPFRKAELLARVKTHIKLKNTENELRDLIKMKDRLFSIIGHDLRGPIGTFMMVMDTITDESRDLPEDKVKRYLQQMKDTSKGAYGLLENLLTWARSQQKLVTFEPAVQNLNGIVEDTIKVLDGTAKSKSITLKNELEPEISGFFDKNSISTVIRNLISNALKFTEKDGEIKISCFKEDNELHISVKDSGIGMKEAAMNKLFKKDQITTTRGTNGEKGTGLGLLLCKDFVVGNNGRIWVESEIGKGTVFTFSVPVSG